MTAREGDVAVDGLTFFPALNDETPTNTIRRAPQAKHASIERPSITSLLFTPKTSRGRDALFGDFDPLANELDDALQDQSHPTHLRVAANEFEGLERCTSAPPEETHTVPKEIDAQKKPGRRKHGNSVSSIPAYFRPRTTPADKTSSAPVSQHVSRPSSSLSRRDLAPVEMNSWFLQEDLPPALNKQNGPNTVTDGFGFLYEEKRKRKQHDGNRRPSLYPPAAQPRSPISATFGRNRPASISISINSAPVDNDEEDEKAANMRWHDFLMLDTTATASYLSDMPLLGANRIMDRVRSAVGGYSSTQGALNKAEPVVAISTQAVTSPSGEAFSESIRSETSSATDVSVHTQDTSNASPSGPSQTAAALLQQLNDEHERSQQKKKAEFEDFMNKSLVHRLRGNDEGTSANSSRSGEGSNQLHISPEAHLVEGSAIGFASIGLGGKGAKTKRKELHRLILQGIPVELRSKVWGECMRSQVQGDPEYYHALLTSPAYAGLDDPTILEAIDADVQRTLKDNIYFRDIDGPGSRKLTDVLIAVSRRCPQVGYCQGMNLIVGSLLLVLPTSEEVFWMMVFLMESILPADYMGATLLTSRADAKVLRSFVVDHIPQLAQHLERHDVWLEFEVNAISWFVSAFTAVFCGEALYRIWDVMFCWSDGDVFALCTALALLKLNEKALLACQGRSEISGYLNGQMTDHAVSVDGVIRAASALRKVVRREDVDKRRKEEVAGLLAG